MRTFTNTSQTSMNFTHNLNSGDDAPTSSTSYFPTATSALSSKLKAVASQDLTSASRFAPTTTYAIPPRVPKIEIPKDPAPSDSFFPSIVLPTPNIDFSVYPQPGTSQSAPQEVSELDQLEVVAPGAEEYVELGVPQEDPQLIAIPFTQDTESAEGEDKNYLPWIIAGVAGVIALGSAIYVVRSRSK